MAQKMGDKGRNIPLKIQFLLVEIKDGSHLESDDVNESNQIVYIVFVPLIEGSFEACLQGNDRNKLELGIESGDSNTKASSFSHRLFINTGTDPFTTIHDASFKAAKDFFGWCTWNAFYHEVMQEGLEDRIQSSIADSVLPKFPLSSKVRLTVGDSGGIGEGGGEIHKKNKGLRFRKKC